MQTKRNKRKMQESEDQKRQNMPKKQHCVYFSDGKPKAEMNRKKESGVMDE